MNIVNETPFTYAPFMGKVVYPKDTLTLIVKGTFKLAAGQPAQPAEPGDHLPPTGDLHYGDDPQSSCRYESDFVHFKPRADVFVVGHCHVPGGIPRATCPVRFSVGPISKALMVFGRRRWKRTRMGTRSISDPEPFTRMELRYENSFGGIEYLRNPIGKGIPPKDSRPEHPEIEVPNLKVLEGEQLLTMHAGTPAGFGPLGRTWSQRMALAGSYGKKWRSECWPWLPEDFDWGFFNAAPSDQQIKGYLKGNEALFFENLHPEHSTFHAALPGTRVRCFLSDRCDGVHRFREVKTQLDTLWADMDAEQLMLVWRGLATVSSKTCEEVEDVLIVQEAMEDEPHSLEHYEKLYQQRKARPGSKSIQADDAQAAEPAQIPALKKSTADVERDDTLDAQIEQAMAQARAALEKTQIDPKLAAALKTESDPERFLDWLAQSTDVHPGAVEKMQGHARQQYKQLLVRHRPEVGKLLARTGYEAPIPDNLESLEDELEAAEEATTPIPSKPAETARPGEDAGDRDMRGADFSGKVLEGADFREAQLEGANFLHARLAGASFCGAQLEGAIFEAADLSSADLSSADLKDACFTKATLRQANFSDTVLIGADLHAADLGEALLCRAQLNAADLTLARLQGADLEQVDLTGAKLVQADLSGAKLELALLEGADLTQARLKRAKGRYVSLVGANLTEADLTQAELEEGNFSGCRCDLAIFTSALLNRATFERAVGRQVNLQRAALNQVRAGEGVRLPQSSFRRAAGAGSNWAGSDLQGSDFILAQMPGSDFSAANLTGCDCRTAELKQSVFDQACLHQTKFNRANLFQVRMQEADLTGADFKGCNLYGSEFLDATIDKKTNFKNANLKGTKLAKLNT